MNLVELFDNIVQMEALNGVPLANGHMYVYALGRTRLMDTWSDIEGTVLNTNPIILDDAGQAHVYVSDDFDYTLVVCDEYNNEVFSIDKYLYSKGEHSHADVAVAPSEHIAVSSYHVGETTVYVPYIQGELGKTYHGIEPIVVNNQENKISARNIPLGVQEPLYFVEDSESACIIGASGLQPSGNYATVDWVIEHDYMQKEKLEFNESGQVTGFDGSAFAAGYVDPSDFIPWSASSTFQSAGNYATTDDLTAYYPTSNPDGFINSDAISAMATTGLVADVSGDITAQIPSTAGLATENWVTSQGYLTEHQSLDGLMSASLLESSGGLITGYNGTAFAGQGGSVTGEYELSAGNGISINNDPIEQKTVISVSGDYLTKDSADTIYQPIGNYLSSNALEGYATENWVTSQGYITTETDWSDTITAASANAYNEAIAAIPTGLATTGDLASVSADITAQIPTDLFTKASADTLYQPIGDYLTTGDSANFATTGDVEDLVSAISETYQTTAGMTAYQSAGDYLTTGDSAEFMTTAERSDYIPTGVSSEFYTTANTANYISEVPDTYLQNTDLSTEDGKVTAISGIPLSAGVNLSAIAQLLGVDETVLYSGNSTDEVELSEDPTNFNYLRIDYGAKNQGANANVLSINVPAGITNYGFSHLFKSQPNSTVTSDVYKSYSYYSGCNTTTWVKVYGTISQTPFTNITSNKGWTYIYKIVGIGRKQ